MASFSQKLQTLTQLKQRQLHQLAASLGVACSGTKGRILDSIQEGFGPLPAKAGHLLRSQLSVVSVDLGVQHLAYACLVIPHQTSPISKSPPLGKTEEFRPSHNTSAIASKPAVPSLYAWERFSVADLVRKHEEEKRHQMGEDEAGVMDKPLHTPSQYSLAAYQFIASILHKHNPTHVILEQQRFRSGGRAAVAEWTLRVGVFEGILHAVLRTLREEHEKRAKRRSECQSVMDLQEVVSIDPARSTRFWLEGRQTEKYDSILSQRLIKRAGKQAKIDIAARSLVDPTALQLVHVGTEEARAMRDAFIHKWRNSSKAGRAHRSTSELRPREGKGKQHFQPGAGEEVCNDTKFSFLTKLDDLADCLLQAVAWLEWQRAKETLYHDLATNNTADAIAAIRTRLAG